MSATVEAFDGPKTQLTLRVTLPGEEPKSVDVDLARRRLPKRATRDILSRL
jgi:hypothetical protein